jgi:flavin-binding protein dodecin
MRLHPSRYRNAVRIDHGHLAADELCRQPPHAIDRQGEVPRGARVKVPPCLQLEPPLAASPAIRATLGADRELLVTCEGARRSSASNKAIFRRIFMAKKKGEGVYKIVEVVGVSEKSWEDAGRSAIETAADSLRDLRVAEVVKMDMKVEKGKVAAFRTRVSLSFKYES